MFYRPIYRLLVTLFDGESADEITDNHL